MIRRGLGPRDNNCEDRWRRGGCSERVQRIDTAVQRTGNVVTAIVHRPVHDLTNRKRLKSNWRDSISSPDSMRGGLSRLSCTFQKLHRNRPRREFVTGQGFGPDPSTNRVNGIVPSTCDEPLSRSSSRVKISNLSWKLPLKYIYKGKRRRLAIVRLTVRALNWLKIYRGRGSWSCMEGFKVWKSSISY